MTFALSSLPPMDVVGRLPRLRAALTEVEGGCDGLLVTNLTNIRYLTGFTGSAAVLLATGVEATVAIGRTADEQRDHLVDPIGGLTTLGLEADDVSWAQQRRFATDWFAGTEMVATGGLVERLRSVKDAGEVARIEAASSMAD